MYYEHERCHVRSFDLWMKYFYEALTIVFWWNPVIWVFKTQFNQIIELKADESVTKKLSEKEKIGYVETLFKVSQFVQGQTKVSILKELPSFSSSKDSLLLDRVNNIFYKKKSMNDFLVIAISGIIGLSLSSCIIFEPYIDNVEVEQEYFKITKDNSVLKKIEGGNYQIYTDGKPLFEITEKERIQRYDDLKIESH